MRIIRHQIRLIGARRNVLPFIMYGIGVVAYWKANLTFPLFVIVVVLNIGNYVLSLLRLAEQMGHDRIVKVKPYGKWWRCLLRGKIELAYRCIFGWKMKLSRLPLIDNMGMQIEL